MPRRAVRKRRTQPAVWLSYLILYIIVLVAFLLFKNHLFALPRKINPTLTEILLLEDPGEITINLQPLATIKLFLAAMEQPQMILPSLVNIIGNVICFMPIGILYPLYRQGQRYVRGTLVISLATSLMVEASQLLTGWGVFDVDDLLLNFLGGIIGMFCFIINIKSRLQDHCLRRQ